MNVVFSQEYSVMSFDQICRLCLRESSALSSLLVDSRAQMLENLTSIKVCQADPSVQVCLTCLYNLKLAFEIQQNMKEADVKLREMWTAHENKAKTKITRDSSHSGYEFPKKIVAIIEKSHCVICGGSVDTLKTSYQAEKSFENIIMCDSCNRNIITYFSDYKQNIVSGHLRSAFYQCHSCNRPFFHKSVYMVHMRNAHMIEDNGEEDERVTSPISDDMVTEDDDSSPNWPVAASPEPDLSSTTLLEPGRIRKITSQRQTKRPRPFVCKLCNKSYTCRKRLETHVHKAKPKRIYKRKPCPICHKEYDTCNLSAHIARHSAESQICELCGAKFKNKWNLRTHIYYSHSAYRYKCDKCDKVFQKHSKLTLHIKRDHDENPDFMCDNCGKKFYTKPNLNAHVNRIHLKLKPHVCEFCKKSFSSKQDLNAHKKKHTVHGSPYRCELCGEGFRQKVSLRSHNKLKHNIVEAITVLCKKCGKGFSSDTALLSHKRAVCF